MAQYIDKSALIAEIEKYISNYKEISNKVDKSSDDWVYSTLMLESKIDVLQHILSFLDTLEVKEVREESVSKDLEEAAFDYAEACKYDGGEKLLCVEHFKAGAQWQKQQNTLEVKEVDLNDAVEEAKDMAKRDIAWDVHVMISEGKSIAEIDHYVCGICDF